MSDDERRRAFRERHELRRANEFLRGVRQDFANRDAIDQGALDPEFENACNLCWAEAFASIRALTEIAEPGMTDDDLALGCWEWMHSERGPWSWKKRRRA